MRALVDSLRNGPGERVRPAVSWRRNGNWGRDAEMATRRLLRARTFAAATIGTLTIGLGMVAVVYTVVHKILIEPMPYRDADALYYVWRDYGPILDLKRGGLAGPDFAELRKSEAVVEDVAALQPMLGGIFAPREGADPTEIAVTVVTPNLFELLGVTPMLGRGFAPNEAGPGRPNLIVLTHALWNRLGADPALVGAQVRLQGNAVHRHRRPAADVCVRAQRCAARAAAHRRVHHVRRRSRGASPATAGTSRRSCARVPGRRRQAVASAVDAAGRTIDARDFNSRGLRLYPVGLKADVVARARPALLVLGAAGALLALMLMVNLASVLLARAAQREHEFAVSRALGASDVAVMRATLFEGGLLGLIGGAAGALVAIWATRALVALAPLDLPRRDVDRGGLADRRRDGRARHAARPARGGGAGDLGGARDVVVAAREQRRAGRRRPRPHAARDDRHAGGALARAPRQRAGSWCAASSACCARIRASIQKACSPSASGARRSSFRSRPTWSGSRIASSARSRRSPASRA